MSEKVPAIHDEVAHEIRFACECGNIVHIDNPDPFELLSLYQGSMSATCEACRKVSDLELDEAETCELIDSSWDDGICTWGVVCSGCGARHEHETGVGWNYAPCCGRRIER